MKKFPCIYSLSTLGIRHHQHFDYFFHPFRTDFVGESASGKSMIADILQLIVVGSEKFDSPTESFEERDPDGMVLKTGGKGTEIGYVFLNIETGPDQFLIVGAYLQSSVKTTLSFIIQQGYDEENLATFQVPFLISSFLNNDKILPIDELRRHIESQGLVCHVFPHRKKFHKILFQNEILSLDLSFSEQALKDYAAIIQSFSRGNVLELGKSNSLKSFLFGDEKGKELNKKFKDTIADMQLAVNEYGKNRTEISRIVRKQKDLLHLCSKKQDQDNCLQIWLTELCAYCYQQENNKFHEVLETIQTSFIAHQQLKTLSGIINDELDNCISVLTGLATEVIDANREYEEQLPDYKALEKGTALLNRLNCSTNELTDKYQSNKVLARRKYLITALQGKMKKTGVWEYFQTIEPVYNVSDFINNLLQIQTDLENQANEKTAYLSFTDITDKNSFGYWALQQKRALTLEEESVIMHFKQLKTNKPANPESGDKFIPQPDVLLKDLSITTPSGNGFWMQLGGIMEYISTVKKQLFIAGNLPDMERVFELVTQNLRKDLEILQQQITEVKKLSAFILSEKDFADFLDAMEHQNDTIISVIIDELNISEESFNKTIDVLNNAIAIEKSYKKADTRYEAARAKQQQFTSYKTRLEQEKNTINGLLNENTWTGRVREIYQEFRAELKLLNDEMKVKKVLQADLYNASDKMAFINRQVETYRTGLGTFKITTKRDEYETAKEEKLDAWAQYSKAYSTEVDTAIFGNDYKKYPRDEKSAFDLANRYYNTSFTDLVDEYIPGEKFRFQDNPDFVELSRLLLPEAFKEMEIKEESVIDTIETYLQSINEKNKELSKRKLQKIQELLAEVQSEISARYDQARKIDFFLNEKDKEITGGIRTRLKINLSREYPKSWLETFSEKLYEEGTLFQQGVSLTDLLSDSISLEEKLVAAFFACGGNQATKPRIEKLLDPNSYFDLSFSMESVSNSQSNKGSSGQTYAAIALLCIARLSLINREEKAKSTGIKFMPMDEAEGLGSNYDMLYQIALQHEYQIISFSINPLGKFRGENQHLYMLHRNYESEYHVNYEPFAIFCDADKDKV